MDKLLPLIAAIVVVSQVIAGLMKKRQREAQKERQRSAATRTKAPWEFGQVKRISIPKKETKVEMPMARPRKSDDEFRPPVAESAAPDEEETFKAETVTQTQTSERKGMALHTSAEPSVPRKRKPVRIAGIPLTSQTISQGIIVSEILRRPEF